MTYCPNHDVSWTGFKACHCEACGLTFSSPTSFDAHRIGEPNNRHCLTPAQLKSKGIELLARGLYGQPRESASTLSGGNFLGVSE